MPALLASAVVASSFPTQLTVNQMQCTDTHSKVCSLTLRLLVMYIPCLKIQDVECPRVTLSS